MKAGFLEILKQLDRHACTHNDAVDPSAILAVLRRDGSRYPSLRAALEYRDWLRELPVGKWVTLHQQRVDDEVFFGRQNHGGSAFDSKRGRLVLFGSDTHD